ncbi:hypothetical protein [Natronomonas sp. EA1]|uniref:hypothetical protein n=1 Tax=Natronomonas sp. EA1 TaxID=3421655 RepID=UPI003EBD3C5A
MTPTRSERQGRVGRGTATLAALTAALIATTGTAAAHGVPGGDAVLEGIPPWLYLTSGGAVVFASFALAGAFIGRRARAFSYRHRFLRAEDFRPARLLARVASVTLLAFVVALGLFGPNDVLTNPAPVFLVEVFWWVSYSILALLVVDVWRVIAPWTVVFEWLGEPSLDREYPDWLGALPALVAFLVFVWLNMVVLAFAQPILAAALAASYFLVMLAGMAVFGKDAWLENADAFTLVFGFFGRFAPLALTDEGIEVRAPAVGLVREAVTSVEGVLLVVAMLYALTFDGFKETETFLHLFIALPNPGLHPTLWGVLWGGAILLTGYVAFVAAYAVVSLAMARASGESRPLGDVMRRFVLSLVPIAAAYHLAHYSLYYLLQHELLVAVLARPLPGAAIVPEPDLVAGVTPALVWYWMVGLIVVGHVVAVWVAHHAALDYFDSRRAAVRSQVPMLALMVFYTVVSLWIVSQPFGA